MRAISMPTFEATLMKAHAKPRKAVPNISIKITVPDAGPQKRRSACSPHYLLFVRPSKQINF